MPPFGEFDAEFATDSRSPPGDDSRLVFIASQFFSPISRILCFKETWAALIVLDDGNTPARGGTGRTMALQEKGEKRQRIPGLRLSSSCSDLPGLLLYLVNSPEVMMISKTCNR